MDQIKKTMFRLPKLNNKKDEKEKEMMNSTSETLIVT